MNWVRFVMRFVLDALPPASPVRSNPVPQFSRPYLPLPAQRKRVAVTASSAGALINSCHSLILDMVNRGHRVSAFAPGLSNDDLRILWRLGAKPCSLPAQHAIWEKHRRVRELGKILSDANPHVLLVEFRTQRRPQRRRRQNRPRASCRDNGPEPRARVRYLKKGGSNDEYFPRILDEIENMPVCDITQDVIDDLAEKLYPGRTAATLNRQVYTPIAAVLNALASKTYTPPRITRPKGHLAPSNFKRPPKDWFQRVLPECPPNLAAFLLFCRLHGRRTTEACRITPADIEADTWQVTVMDTKGEQTIRIKLAAPVIEQLSRYSWRLNQYVFGFSSKSRVYKALRPACERAGVEYHVPKDAGRHSFATGLLEERRTLKEVQEAGRWKSIKMPAMHYGHLEHSRVDDDAREIGEKWAEK